MPQDDPSQPRTAPVAGDDDRNVALSSINGHVRHLDHVAIAAWQIKPLLPLYRDLFGGRFVLGGDDTRRGLRTLQLKIPGQVKVELMMPTRQESTLRPFLERHGPGVHHITLFVHEVVAAMSDLHKAGFETTGTDLSNPRWRETYIRPPSAGGVLIQLADTTEDWSRPLPETSIADVLSGTLEWIDYAPSRVGEGDASPSQSDDP